MTPQAKGWCYCYQETGKLCLCPKSHKVAGARILLVLEWVVAITHMNEETEEGPEKDRAPVNPAWYGVYPCCHNSGPAPSLLT